MKHLTFIKSVTALSLLLISACLAPSDSEIAKEKIKGDSILAVQKETKIKTK
jgi:hypothetical protein